MPVRNEGDFIERSLGSILAQDYPEEHMEILVVDGMSEDDTRKIIQRLGGKLDDFKEPDRSTSSSQNQKRPIIKLLDNPSRIVPTALNIGLAHARGDIIMRVDGHCEIPSDYIRRCIELIRATGADNVGGALQTVNETFVGRALAVASSSYFGVGGSRFRCSKKAGWTDTVFPGVFKRDLFERIGNFDEELVRNQDDEFNFRLLQAGGKIWLDPSIKVIYYSRNNLLKFWKQWFQYGFYKVRVIQKRRTVLSWRHLVPPAFTLGLIVSLLIAVLSRNFLWALLVAGPYLIVNLAAILWESRRDWRTLPLLPLAFFILHFSYGCGFLCGLWRWRGFWW